MGARHCCTGTGICPSLQPRLPAKTMKGLELLSCEEWLRELGLLGLERRQLNRELINTCKYLTGGRPEDGARPSPVGQNEGQQAQTETQGVPCEQEEKILYPEESWALNSCSERLWSLLQDTIPPRHGPVHPVVGEPVLALELGQVISRGSFKLQPICESGI